MKTTLGLVSAADAIDVSRHMVRMPRLRCTDRSCDSLNGQSNQARHSSGVIDRRKRLP
jgi:hypothetical protein